MRTWCRHIAGELVALGAQPLDIGINVIGAETQVMQPAATLLELRCNGPCALQRMNQLYVCLGHTKKRRRGLGRLHHFIAVMLESEILEKTRDRALKIRYGNRNMVQCSNHETVCLLQILWWFR